jgi:hypothetical protein
MKFNEVIINENKLGDWMFGNKANRGKSVGGTGGATVGAPSIGVKGGLTKQDRLAYKLFVQDFMSDALSTIDSGLKSGLINPPLNKVQQEQARETDVEQAGGRELHVFLRDWLGQWMQNVDYTKSKDVLYNIINNLEQVFNNSNNTQKPSIDRNILRQLADGAWAASSSVGVSPLGAKNAQGAEVIQKSIQAQGAKQPELKSKETPMKPIEIPAGIAIKDAGGTEYFYNGKQWTNSSGQALSADSQQKYSKMYAMDPKTFYKSELAPQTKAEPVKESKTQSAIRAEKIPSLQTR